MTDIELAKENLGGHSICLCLDGKFITDDGRGISPMMKFIAQGRGLRGYSAADAVVGKAAAMLFVKVGVIAVYGVTMSKSAYEFLNSHSVTCTYGTLVGRIVNRVGDDICPMEKTVADIGDVEKAYEALREKIAEMKK